MGDRAFSDGFVTANGIRLHYVDWGGDGPPALLLHPTSFHAHVWTPYVRHLQPRFHCYGLDSRGHGDSDKPGSYGWPDFQADLIGFMHAIGLRGVLAIGHSAGGTFISLAAAEEPELVARAVLLDPILFLEDVPPRPATSDAGLAGGARKRRMNWPSREAILQSYGSRPPFNAWDRAFLEDYVRFGVRDEPDGTVTLKCDGADEAAMYRWGPRRLPSELVLPQIRCPVLLVAGARSESLPPAKAQRAAELLPHGELLSVPDTGHFVPFERPGVVLDAIDRFIARTDPQPPVERRGA